MINYLLFLSAVAIIILSAWISLWSPVGILFTIIGFLVFLYSAGALKTTK